MAKTSKKEVKPAKKLPVVAKPKKVEGAAKPAAPRGKQAAAAAEGEAQTVAQARRLTPEAKAAINAMVAKGVPLAEALRRAGSWETFVAPVREEPKPGGDFRMGGQGPGPGGPRRFRKREEDDEESSSSSESEEAED